MKAITLTQLQQMKQNGEKIAMLTAYDASFAALEHQAGVDVLLVGDSLGMVVQGHRSTVPVRTTDMAYHTRCVRQGAADAFLLVDMPFMANCQLTDTVKNAKRLMQAGANMVKLEGSHWLTEHIQLLLQAGVPSCAHIGLTPQSVNQLGGYKVQGRDKNNADTLIASAQALEQAGAALLLIECVPSPLAKRITQQLSIPVIGIGAGADCDGQVLVMHDALGLNHHSAPKFVENFLAGQSSILDAFSAYVKAVKASTFPTAQHSYTE